MINGELYISTTWAASTSFIPFTKGMQNSQDSEYQGIANRGQFATTAYIQGVWESQLYETGYKDYINNSANLKLPGARYSGRVESMQGMNGPYADSGNAFLPGTILETEVRKLKALKSSPNRSGVQVTKQLVKGNKLLIRYVAKGELVRP